MAKVNPDLPFEDHLTSNNPDLKYGLVETDGSTDWVVKLDMTGLEPYTQYVYAFTDGTVTSDVGLTKTAPAADQMVDDVTYAVFSCSNFPNGYFHAYDIGTSGGKVHRCYSHISFADTASTIEGLDLWIHTGDYLYEVSVSLLSYIFSKPGLNSMEIGKLGPVMQPNVGNSKNQNSKCESGGSCMMRTYGKLATVLRSTITAVVMQLMLEMKVSKTSAELLQWLPRGTITVR